jgi:hypothetical protein
MRGFLAAELSSWSGASDDDDRHCRKMMLCQLLSCWEGRGDGVELSGEEASDFVWDGEVLRLIMVLQVCDQQWALQKGASVAKRSMSATAQVATPAINSPRSPSPPKMSQTPVAISMLEPHTKCQRLLGVTPVTSQRCSYETETLGGLISTATAAQSACSGWTPTSLTCA